MEVVQEFHFLRPYFLLILVLPLLFFWGTAKSSTAVSSWAQVCDENLLKFLLVKNAGGKKRRIPFVLSYLISVVMIVALAGPTWVKKQNPGLSVDNPVMILLNMSSDMWRKDVTPSRGMRAKYVIKDLLQSFGSTETGMLVYSREPFVVTPMTEDAALIDSLLPAMELDIMPENGDRLDRALDLAVERMTAGGYTTGNLVVLTSDVGERFDAALESAAKAGAAGFDVNIINVGSEENEKLKMVAEKGGGLFLNYNQNLGVLSRKINDILAKELKQSENMQVVWEDMGYYLLWFPALLLLYYFRRGLLAVLLVFGCVCPAYAGWFLNADQEGLKAFEAQNYAKAADLFRNVRWRGAAAYKNGDFEAAYADFLQENDATALYNQGNALAKAGKIEEAIAKYEEVLRLDENFEDARFNLEYLKKQKQQQNSQTQQQEQKDKDKQKQEQKQQEQQATAEKQQNDQKTQDAQNGSSQGKQNASQDSSGEEQNAENESQDEDESGAQDMQQQGDEASGENQRGKDKQQGSGSEEGTQKNAANETAENTTGNGNGQNRQTDETTGQDKNMNAAGASGEKGDEEVPAGGYAQSGQPSREEKEKIRARMQKFREIPEDKGGLLRAFIKREYDKKRYQDK